MPIISLIAAVDKFFGIGKNNLLLCHLPADLKHFKTITMGKPILMGRKTYLSIGKPLPGRRNLVLSSQKQEYPGVEVVSNIQEALNLVSDAPELMVIGGESIYSQFMPFAQNIFLTEIDASFDADTFFPAFPQDNWQCRSRDFRAADEKNPYNLSFCHYQKKS